METKHSMKSVSLYYLCVNNDLLLITIIHHIIILLFNYYSVIHLNFLQTQFIKFKTNFELIQYVIEVCQSLTFITLVFLLYFSKPTLEKNIEPNHRQAIIMFVSYLIKLTFVSYQYYYISNDIYIEQDGDTSPFGIFYSIIIASFIIRFFAFGVIIMIIFILLISFISEKIIEWSKNYKINFIQEKKNDGSEDV